MESFSRLSTMELAARIQKEGKMRMKQICVDKVKSNIPGRDCNIAMNGSASCLSVDTGPHLIFALLRAFQLCSMIARAFSRSWRAFWCANGRKLNWACNPAKTRRDEANKLNCKWNFVRIFRVWVSALQNENFCLHHKQFNSLKQFCLLMNFPSSSNACMLTRANSVCWKVQKACRGNISNHFCITWLLATAERV